MVALLGQIHEIKTAWKYAKVLSDLVLEMSAFFEIQFHVFYQYIFNVHQRKGFETANFNVNS